MHMWDVGYTDEFGEWFSGLTEGDQEAIDAAVRILQMRGPALGRPLVDTLRGSRHKNMKERRPSASTIRVLFAFDAERMALPLIGGDKKNRWSAWYDAMIPIADRLLDDHLDELRAIKGQGTS